MVLDITLLLKCVHLHDSFNGPLHLIGLNYDGLAQCLIRCKTDTLVHSVIFFARSPKILMMKCKNMPEFCKYYILHLLLQSKQSVVSAVKT